MHDFQVKYVRNYLLQRSLLLRETRDRILKNKQLPMKLLSEFGIRIFLPRQDTKGKSIEEVWRIDVLLPTDEQSCTNIQMDEDDPSCGLYFPCEWRLVDDERTTVGIPPVKRIVKNLPLLEEWRSIRKVNEAPFSEMEKCVQLCNTIDLDVEEALPLNSEIPRPQYEWVSSGSASFRFGNFDPLYGSHPGALKLVKVSTIFTPTDVLVVNSTTTNRPVTYCYETCFLNRKKEEQNLNKKGKTLKKVTFTIRRISNKGLLQAPSVAGSTGYSNISISGKINEGQLTVSVFRCTACLHFFR